MTTVARHLDEHVFFSGLAEHILDLIADCSHEVRFGPDQTILTTNESANHFYVILEGRVALEIDVPTRGPIIVETLGPGEILGVSWMLPPHRWTFDARAIDETTAIEVDAACLRGKCDEDPAVGYELYKRFAGLVRNRLQATRLQLLDIYGSDAVTTT